MNNSNLPHRKVNFLGMVSFLYKTLIFIIIFNLTENLEANTDSIVASYYSSALLLEENGNYDSSLITLENAAFYLDSLIDELKELTNYVSEDGLQPLSNIVSKLTHQQSDNGWKEFEKRFSEIHIDFYSRLINEFPDLTQNEVKLCAFLKLGMNTKEICSITFQSIRAIEAARLRLRKKLGLDNGENLSIFLQSY